MTEPVLLVERHDHVVLLTLNRPAKLNALSGDLRRTLIATLVELATDKRVRTVVLTGAGRAFCAGLDLAELSASGRSVEENVGDENVVDAIVAFPKPIIGAINGVAITGGFEIALALDILLVGEHASFVDGHVKVGIAPGWGLSQRLSRAVGLSRANELSLSARSLSAKDAVDWGLANRVFPAETLVEEALALAADIAQHEPAGVARMKRLIADGWQRPLGEALRLEDEEARGVNRAIEPDAVAAGFARMRR